MGKTCSLKYFETQQESAIDTTKLIRADDNICVSLLLMSRFKSRVLLLSGVLNGLNLVAISKHLLDFQVEVQPVSLKITEHLYFGLQGSRVLHCQTLDVMSAPCWPLVMKEHLGI